MFDLYKRIQNFPNLKVKNIALKVIERNAYFAHPENILLGMLADPDESMYISEIMAQKLQND